MTTEQEKKEFALSQLAPYYVDPTTCGFNDETETCEYKTPDGRMCVAGKNMINPQFGVYYSIKDLLADNNNNQEGFFKPEVVGILTNDEWLYMQGVHDTIAKHLNVERLKNRIDKLNLFTFEELVERAESLKKV